MRIQVSDGIVIPARFNGPPDSGNGGYTCGCVAGMVEGDVVVSLRAPPPLDRPLSVRAVDGGVDVSHGETVIAQARPAALELELPEAVDVHEAAAASEAGLEHWSTGHPFPTCVVCGPERAPGDGLRIFPAEHGDRFVAGWTPDASLADEDGLVRPEGVWAALDCPTSAPVANFGQGPPIVLARLAARVEGPVRVGAPHALVSWKIGQEGRKRHAGVALFGEHGEPLGRAQALWIELRQ